jgi:hypothetical protein
MVGKLRLLLWIGIVLLFLPFFGVVDAIKTALTVAIGILLIVLTFRLRYAYKKLRFELRQGAPQSVAPEGQSIHGSSS